MWEADSSDDSSDSDTEKDHASGRPEARAAPCMTIGAGVIPSPPAGLIACQHLHCICISQWRNKNVHLYLSCICEVLEDR